MNTSAHLLIGAAAFGGVATPGVSQGGRIMAAALLGALVPDMSLYLMAGFAVFLQNVPPQVVFDQLYFSPAWQTVFAIDNSFPLWAGAMVLAVLFRSAVLGAFAGAGLLHLATDFLMHAGDGRSQFWPFSQWVFHSPVSYWDSTHHANWVVPVVAVACAVAYAVLWGRRPGAVPRVVFGLLLAAELWIAQQWLWFF